ncbi:MAG: DNA mismatch repair protein MutS, partial [Myxococcota bacterium]
MTQAVLADDELLDAAGVTFPPGAKVTPMLRQWLEAKAKAKNAILLFRMGDFYELFANDAETAAPVLDLTLTSRDKDKGDDALAMAGFPHHAAPVYIAKLIAAGFKVAVCDQLEDPALARGIVKRDLTRVVTPGMVLDDESLEAGAHNYLVAICRGAESAASFGIAALELSTGDFLAAVTRTEAALLDEVARLAPREVVVVAGEAFSIDFEARLSDGGGTDGGRRVEARRPHKGDATLLSSLGALDRWFDDDEHRVARVAAELVVGYVAETQGSLPSHLRAPRPHTIESQLLLDATTRRHLDLTGPPGQRRQGGTLLATVDRTKTALGSRKLLALLLAPSCSLDVIADRHDVVEALLADPGLHARVRTTLQGIYDLERLTARVASLRAGPRDLARVAA